VPFITELEIFIGSAIRLVVGIFCIGILLACVNPLQIVSDVDSFARPESKGKQRYILVPGEKGTDANDLQFLEFSAYIEKVLSEKDYLKVPSVDQADIAIFLSYGIGDPQTHQYLYSIPTSGQTGVSSATTVGTVSSSGGMGTYSGTTTSTSTYGVTGYGPQVGSYTTYTRFLIIAGYDIAASAKEAKSIQVWKTEVLSTGNSNDLRLVFPYMVAAMRPYLATNTGEKIQVMISEDDPFILQLRGNVFPMNGNPN
jgi:hypothetical protein